MSCSAILRLWAIIALVALIALSLLWQRDAKIRDSAPVTPEAAQHAPPRGDAEPDLAWGLDVAVSADDDGPLGCWVYAKDARGGGGIAFRAEPGVRTYRRLRGVASILVHAPGYVPHYLEGVGPPMHGELRLTITLARGAHISGTLVDDAGDAVSGITASDVRIRARPLDGASWLRPESWCREDAEWPVLATWVRADGTFCIEGLPEGRYEVRCDQPRPSGAWDESGPLLEPEPVVAAAGDERVCITCRRGVEIRLRFVDATSEAMVPPEVVGTCEAADDGGVFWSASGAIGDGFALNVPVGAAFTLTASLEGYKALDRMEVVANGAAGVQEVAVCARPTQGRGGAELELIVRDELGAFASPLMVRHRHTTRRHEPKDGRYVLDLPSGQQRIEVSTPEDEITGFSRERLPKPPLRVYVPKDVDVMVPRGGSIRKEVTVQRAALIWVQQDPSGVFPETRIFAGDAEVDRGIWSLPRDEGLIAAVPPGAYTIEGHAAGRAVRVDVEAKAGEVVGIVLSARNAR